MIRGEYTDRNFNVRQRFWGRVISFPQKHDSSSLCVKENVRNVNCKHYLTCLDAAALVNAGDLGCGNCRFQTDNTYKMTVRDFKGLMRLYHVIMSPVVSKVIGENQ